MDGRREGAAPGGVASASGIPVGEPGDPGTGQQQAAEKYYIFTGRLACELWFRFQARHAERRSGIQRGPEGAGGSRVRRPAIGARISGVDAGWWRDRRCGCPPVAVQSCGDYCHTERESPHRVPRCWDARSAFSMIGGMGRPLQVLRAWQPRRRKLPPSGRKCAQSIGDLTPAARKRERERKRERPTWRRGHRGRRGRRGGTRRKTI
jgi:hypothetical protein